MKLKTKIIKQNSNEIETNFKQPGGPRALKHAMH
jgi:hypothetical protein